MIAKGLTVIHFLICCFVALCLISHPASADYREVFDISGNQLFAGEELLVMQSTAISSGGGGARDFVHNDRFYRDFNSSVTLTEWVNNINYELRLGRVGTWFTPLTMHKERFRPGYGRFVYHGRWEDQRTIRFRFQKADRETLLLFTKTANAGGDDEDWNYPGSFDDIDIDRYFFAFRHKFDLAGQTLGFSFANEHFTTQREGSFDLKEPLHGDVPDDTPTFVGLLIIDDSPYDQDGNIDQAGAALYSVKTFVNGTEDATLAVVNGDPASANVQRAGNFLESADRVEVIGPTGSGFSHYVIFGFKVPTNVAVTSMKFNVEVSGDFSVALAPVSQTDLTNKSLTPFQNTSGSFVKVKTVRAEGNVRDASNRQTVQLTFNKLTGQSVFGIDLHGLIPFVNIAFNAELARSFRYGKYPVQKGEKFAESADAWYTEFSRDFGKVLFVSKVWDFDVDYDASFAVEDNDDRDAEPDVVDGYVSNLPGIDRNSENGADYEEDWLLFSVDPPVFLEGVDYNNNDVLDNLENDAKPDYPNGWIVGTNGYHVTAAWKPTAGLRLTTGYRDEKKDVDATFNKFYHARARYGFGLPGGDGVLRYDIRRVRDIINNDLVTKTGDVDQRTENQADTLIYRNTDRQQADVTLNFRPMQNLPITTRYAHVYQKRKFSSTIVNQGIAILRTQYENWYPFRRLGFMQDWQILPLFKIQREFQFSEASDKRSNLSDRLTQSFGLEGIRKLSEKTKFFVGHQIQFYSDFLAPKDYNRNVTALQLTHKNRFWDRDLVLTTGVTLESKTAEITSENSETVFAYFRSYFVW